MAELVVMPKAGISVETCVLSQWQKSVGDAVAEGDLIFTYETDKSVFEYRAQNAGVLLATLFQEGDDVPALLPVCIVGQAGEDISALLEEQRSSGVKAKRSSLQAGEEAPVPQAAAEGGRDQADLAKARGKGTSPRARKLSETMGIALPSGLTGSGPNGRVMERDIRQYAQGLLPAPKEEAGPVDNQRTRPDLPGLEPTHAETRDLSNMRKRIAKAMKHSLDSTAQLTHMMAFDAGELLRLRERMKKSGREELAAITVNDMVLYAVSRVISQFPELNAHLNDTELKLFRRVNLGHAVDTPRGLMVPTIFEADRMSLLDISREAKRLAALCQNGDINPDLLSGASFTVTNLGSAGVEYFTPILNAPQTGILGIGSVLERVKKADGAVEAYPAIGMSLTYDHRAIDGAPANRFMAKMKAVLEEFPLLLVG